MTPARPACRQTGQVRPLRRHWQPHEHRALPTGRVPLEKILKATAPPDRLGRTVRRRRRPARPLRPWSSGSAGCTPTEFQERRTERRPGVRQPGHHLLVYSDRRGVEKIFPFDLIPRAVAGDEWDDARSGPASSGSRRSTCSSTTSTTTSGSCKEGVIPAELVLGVEGVPPGDGRLRRRRASMYIHICGTDLIRDPDGQFLVLEDNGRTPVGRELRAGEPRGDEAGVPAAVRAHAACGASRTTRSGCARRCTSVAPPARGDPPCVVLLSPGPYNSAYFEHSFLARHMGVELVDGPGPVRRRRHGLPARRRAGPQRVDVIYRRLDDDFLDPEAFRPDSLLGVPGLMQRLPRRQRRAGQRRRHRRRRRQGDLPVRRGHDPVLPERGADPAERADVHLRRDGRPQLRARAPRRAGRQGGQRVGRLRHADGAVSRPRQQRAEFAREDPGQPAELHRPAGRELSHLPDLDRRGPGPAARRPAAVHPQRQDRPGCCPAA